MDQRPHQPTPDELFERFWAAFPRKVGKGAARAEWKRINPSLDTVQQMFVTLAWQRQTEQWRKDGGQWIPHPRTWLHQERWEDRPIELDPAPAHEPWWDECSRLHGGSCGKALHHFTKMREAS